MISKPASFALSLLLALSVASCGGGSNDASPGGEGGSPGAAGAAGSGPSGKASGLPCEVETLLTTRCQQCHSDPPQFGAPMPLVTREHLAAPSSKDPQVSYAARAVVRMHDAQSPMPQPPNPLATEAEIGAMDAWVKAGLPAGNGCTGSAGSGGSGSGGAAGSGQYTEKLACTPDLSLKPPSPWAMGKDVEDIYVCYGVDLPGSDKKRHVTGLDARIDNSTIVHHILTFEAPATEDPTPHPCVDLFPQDWKLVYAWAPGTRPYNLPSEAGYPVEPGAVTHYVVQVHYSNLKHLEGQTDATGVDLCTTTDLRPNDADLVAVGGMKFNIPARDTRTVECSLKVPKGLTTAFPINVFRAWPHMHQLGKSLSTTVVHADGSESPLGSVATWNFFNQIGYEVDTKINVGDTITTRCSWDNTTDSDVGYGEKTGDEMCYNFITYYPKVNMQLFSGITPAALSSCKNVE